MIDITARASYLSMKLLGRALNSRTAQEAIESALRSAYLQGMEDQATLALYDD